MPIDTQSLMQGDLAQQQAGQIIASSGGKLTDNCAYLSLLL
jgi:hypothetical protein